MGTSPSKRFSMSFLRVILLLAHYFICYGYFYRLLASYLTIQIDPTATMILPSLQCLIYLLTLFVSAVLAWPAIQYGYRKFKENLNQNISRIALFSAVLIGVNIALSLVVALVTQTNGSNNQTLINEAKDSIPFLTIFASCVIAPFVEECVFRSGAFAWLRGKGSFLLSAIISSLLFASIHFIDSLMSGNFADLSYLIVYFGLGIILAYSYEKSESIVVSFSVHFVNNALSMLFMFL